MTRYVRYPNDETEHFKECEMCGSPFEPETDNSTWCADCTNEEYKRENLYYAKEEFDKAIDKAMLNPEKKNAFFALGALQEAIKRIASESELWSITTLLCKHMGEENK